jgi:hypothetical protein
MDFFHGLDNGKSTDFKVNCLNSLQVKPIDPPKGLNEMFTLVNNWHKPKALSGGGYSRTYAMKADKVKMKDQNNRNKNTKQEAEKEKAKKQSGRKRAKG